MRLACLEGSRNPIFLDPFCQLDDVRAQVDVARERQLPSDCFEIGEAADCIRLVTELREGGRLQEAMAIAAHGRSRFPTDGTRVVLEVGILEDLGFPQQAGYRYQESLQVLPDNPDPRVSPGACEVASGQVRSGVRRLVDVAASTEDPQMRERLLDFITAAAVGEAA